MSTLDISNNDLSADNDITCQCGRSKDKVHCPICGRSKTYGYSNGITRAHPVTGEMDKNVRLFRCEVCGAKFDDFQWRYECHAPLLSSILVKERQKMSMEQWRNRATAGVKFSENDKRAFKKYVKVGYEDFMQMWRNAESIRIKTELAKLEHAKPSAVVIHDNSKPSSAYDAHIEQCQKCMIADELNQHCDAGKILFKLKGA